MSAAVSPAAKLRARVTAGGPLVGTFLKTPAHDLVELLALTGLDFLCLDAEHAPFDANRMDACLAVGRALGFPVLVRVASAEGPWIGQALDMGAAGVVVPHVMDVEGAQAVVRRARYGHGGRGFAGGVRGAGLGTQTMAETLARTGEPLVIAQIEDPEAVDAVEAIAAVPGLDGLFLGPADLSVAHGETATGGPALEAALPRVGAAARAHGLVYASFVRDVAGAEAWRTHGMQMFFVASEHGWIRSSARAVADGVHALEGSPKGSG